MPVGSKSFKSRQIAWIFSFEAIGWVSERGKNVVGMETRVLSGEGREQRQQTCIFSSLD